jgi:apolipoprotein N-acyltransferase
VATDRRSDWRGDLLAILAGALLPLAFAPFGLFPLALLAPALLFALWLPVTPRRAFWRGWLFGLGLFGVGVSWIQVSIYHYGGVSVWVALGITALFVLILALFPAFLGYLANRFYPGNGDGKVLIVLPAAWTLFEWLRGWIFTGFPWLSLGYSQTDTALAGLAPVLGVYGVSWATILSAALVLQLVRTSRISRVYPALVLAVLWGGAWLLGRVEWTEPDHGPITVSLVQGNVEQGLKWRPEQRRATLETYVDLTRQHWDSDLIIWPETAIPAFYHQVEYGFIADLKREASRHGADLLIGVPVLDLDTQRYYNSLVSLDGSREDGGGMYRKHHLVPFTEYLPFKEVVGGVVNILDVPMSDFSAGASVQPALDVAGTRVGTSICFEVAFGEEIIRALPDARLLVNVSNDAWFGRSLAPHQHLQIARIRAMEAGRPLLRATNTGITAVIDHRGGVRAILPQFEVGVLSASVQPRAGMTPYAAAGNLPPVVGFLSILGIAALRRVRWPGRVEGVGPQGGGSQRGV